MDMILSDEPFPTNPRLVTIPERFRRMDESKVADLMESIGRVGLLSPITIRSINDGQDLVLVAGRHRLAAALRLGMETISAVSVTCDDTEARLMEIAKNLHRVELTVIERSEHIAEWIRLTEVSAQVAPNPQGGRPQGGVRAAARELGIDRDEARRAVRIASIAPEARQAAREAGLDDNQSALLRVAAAAAPEAQVEVVAGIVRAKTEKRTKTPTIVLDASEYKVEPTTAPQSGNEANALFDLFLMLDRQRQKEFYALVIGAFMPQTPPEAVARPAREPVRPECELLSVQRKLLETEFVVALDTVTKENPAWGLTRDGWTAVEMLLGIIASAAKAEKPVEVATDPEPILDRTAPWKTTLPADPAEEATSAPGKLDVAALVKPLLDTPKARADRRRAAKEAQKEAA
jgi:ParB-like chromosome segregation protein Spo0J